MVGRKEEIKILEDCSESNKPEFLALYGRRRVGKTYLIKEFFHETFSFYATGVQNGNTKEQLKAFRESLIKYGDEERSIPNDWFEAFSRLQKLLEKDDVRRDYRAGKRVIFLDELPWMDRARSDFKSALDYFWNAWGSAKKDVFLIVCGSATTWVIKNIINDTGGFYNRITKQIHLLPFSLNECEQFLLQNNIEFTRKQIVESYMVFGGIPYYLNYFDRRYSIEQNIDILFFRENSPFKYEFKTLFSSLFKNSEQYVSIVREIFSRKRGVTRQELLDSGKTVTGKELTGCLESLEQCGFIRKYRDFAQKKNGCRYQLIDPFCLFHLAFLESGKTDSWLNYINTPGYHSWSGLAFENVCLLHTKQIKHALGITGISSWEYSWNSRKSSPGVQIDLLIDRKDDVINICETKFTENEFEITAAYEKDLRRKVEVFREETGSEKSLQLTMISFSGIKHNAYKNVVVHDLTGEELFAR